jgi:hypothetical protein
MNERVLREVRRAPPGVRVHGGVCGYHAQAKLQTDRALRHTEISDLFGIVELIPVEIEMRWDMPKVEVFSMEPADQPLICNPHTPCQRPPRVAFPLCR